MNLALSALTFLGRHGRHTVPLSLFLGMCVPPLSALMKPLLPVAVFCLLTLAMIRMEKEVMRTILKKPHWLAAIGLWMMLGIPGLTGAIVWGVGLLEASHDLALALVLAASAPPVMAAAAFCFLLGLNGTLAVVGIAIAMILTPLTAPIPGWFLFGEAMPIDPIALSGTLFVFLAGSGTTALVVRQIWTEPEIKSGANLIDGLNVILLFTFAVAIMDGVLIQIVADPLFCFGLVLLSFLTALLSLGFTALLFLPMGKVDAASLGMIAGVRNMGLMASTMMATIPDITWTYFALAQFPIYFLPQIMAPILRLMGLDQRETSSDLSKGT